MEEIFLIGNVLDKLPLPSTVFLQELNRIRKNQPYLNSRFNTKLASGQLNRDELAQYTIYLYNQSREFPTYIAAQLANCPHPYGRRKLAVQVLEEVGANVLTSDPAYGFEFNWDNRPHEQLAKDFAHEVGVPEEHLDSPTKHARRWMRLRFKLSNVHWLLGCTVNNFMTERSIAESRPVWIRALQDFYGIKSEKGLAFHKLHAWIDLRHAAIGEEMLERYATGEADQRAILKGLVDYLKLGIETFDSFVAD